ncbi:MAG: hypothetical protein AB8C84_07760 [Oligoflexales bacterium]
MLSGLKIVTFGFLIPFLVSCGDYSISDVIENPRVLVDPTVNMKTDSAFHAYIHSFEKYHKNSVKLPIIFDDENAIENPDHAAVCIKNFAPVKSRYIVVRRENWDKLDAHGAESLIFHELGHCVLDLDHEDDLEWVDLNERIRAKYPVSFMSSRHWLGERPNRASLIERMFDINIDEESPEYREELNDLNKIEK